MTASLRSSIAMRLRIDVRTGQNPLGHNLGGGASAPAFNLRLTQRPPSAFGSGL